jgi:hypothetical protein
MDGTSLQQPLLMGQSVQGMWGAPVEPCGSHLKIMVFRGSWDAQFFLVIGPGPSADPFEGKERRLEKE